MRATQLLPVLTLLSFSHAALADLYKCQLPGGSVKYQEAPCSSGKETRLSLPAAPAAKVQPQPSSTVATELNSHVEGKPRGFTASETLVLRLPGIPIRTGFQIMADFAGYRLLMDPSITGEGTFEYETVPWSAILADMAARYNVVTEVSNGTLTVRRR